jgi:proteasome lid subunit RPN8/RPN11
MNTRVKQTITSLACATPECEVCGFIVRGEGAVWVHPCENVSHEEDGQGATFEIDPQQYISANEKGRVCAMYHSHPKGHASFSEADLEVAREMELPSHVYAVEDGSWATYIPEGYEVPLTGTLFAWGEADCYETVRVYYRQKLGVYIGDYDRDETFREAAPDAILKHIEAEGFSNLGVDVAVAREHDVLLFDTPGHRFPHHLGVCLTGNRFLHHPYGGLSRVDDLNGHLLKRLLGVLRYVKGPLRLRP